MPHHKYIATLCCTLLFVCLAACDERASAGALGTLRLPSNTDYSANFVVGRSVYHRTGYLPLSVDRASVLLWSDDSSYNCYGGTVTLNGDTLVAKRLNNRSTHYKLESRSGANAVVPLTYDGSWHVFRVSGNGLCFPSFVDSLRTPNAPVAVTFPTINDSISKSSGATLSWNSGSGRHHLTVRDSNNVERVNVDLNTSTTYNLTTSTLANFPLGTIAVEVSRHRNRVDSTGNIARGIVTYSRVTIEAKLVP